MSCEQIKQMMTDKLAGELTPAKEQFLQNHLESCDNCKKEFDALSKTWDLTTHTLKGDLLIDSLTDQQHQELQHAAQQERRHKTTEEQIKERKTKQAKQSEQKPWIIKFSWTEIAASIVIFIALGFMLLPRLGLFKSRKKATTFDQIQSMSELKALKPSVLKKVARTAKLPLIAAPSKEDSKANLKDRVDIAEHIEEDMDDELLKVPAEKEMAVKEEKSIVLTQRVATPVATKSIVANNAAICFDKKQEGLATVAGSPIPSIYLQKKKTLEALYKKLAQYAAAHNYLFPEKNGAAGLKQLASVNFKPKPGMSLQYSTDKNMTVQPRLKAKRKMRMTKAKGEALRYSSDYHYIGGASNAPNAKVTPISVDKPDKTKPYGCILFSNGTVKILSATAFSAELKKFNITP